MSDAEERIEKLEKIVNDLERQVRTLNDKVRQLEAFRVQQLSK